MATLQIIPLTKPTLQICHDVNMMLKDLSDRKYSVDLNILQNIADNPLTNLYLAYAPGEDHAVGMFTLAVTMLATSNHVWLEDVVVAGSAQGRGYGKQLLIHAINQARTICPGGQLMLTSRPSRLAANHLYTSLFKRKETNVYYLPL